EDGIRDFHVTGVQTCALPIWDQSVLFLSRPTGSEEFPAFRLRPPGGGTQRPAGGFPPPFPSLRLLPPDRSGHEEDVLLRPRRPRRRSPHLGVHGPVPAPRWGVVR